MAAGTSRVVSRWQIVALALNDVIGSGVYLLPAAAAALGAFSPGGVVLAGGAVLLVVLCFAEAASRFDGPGSAYLYAREAFGDFAGFEVGWMTFLTRVASLSALSVGFAQAIGWLFPWAAAGPGRVALIVLPLLVLTAVNVRGILAGTRTAAVLLVTKLVPLLVFVLAGLPAISTSRLTATPIEPARLGEVALYLLFAYSGFENTAAAAGEFRDPRRDVPRALLIQIGLVTLLYASVQLVAQGTLPNLATSDSPLADASRLFLGSWAGGLMTAGAAASILGSMGSTVVSGPRYLYALALDGYTPHPLARLHPRWNTPSACIVVQTLIALPLALTGTFTGLAVLSVVARLVTYAGTAAAVPVLRRRYGGVPGAWTLPGGALIPVGALAVCVALMASATLRNLLAGLAALAAGALLYAFRRRSTPLSP